MSAFIVKDTVTPFLDRLKADASQHAPQHAVAIGSRELFKRHIRGIDRTRHRAGVSLHFYEGAANNTFTRESGDTVEVVVNWQGFAQRYYGGRIAPVRAKALTIPTRNAIALGKTRAGDFADDELFMVRRGYGKNLGFLARRNGKGRIQVMFLLRASVNQSPDPSVIPDRKDISDTVQTSLNSFYNRYNLGVRNG